MSNKLELSLKSSLYLVGQGLSKVFSLIYAMVVGRLLGAEIFGEYTYSFSIISLVVVVSSLGLRNGIIRFVSSDKITQKDKNSYFAFGLFSLLVASLVAIIFLIFFRNFFIGLLENGKLFYLVLPSVLLFNANKYLIQVLKGYKKAKETVFIESVILPLGKIISLIVIVICFNVNSVYSLFFVMYLNQTILTFLYLYVLRRNKLLGFTVVKRFDLISFSLPLLLSGLIFTLMTNVDSVMIKEYVGFEQLGVYKAVSSVGGITIFALLSINTIFGPMISKLYSNNEMLQIKELYTFSTKVTTIFNLLVFGMILLYSHDIMALIGPEFRGGGTALVILSTGQIINALVGSVGLINTMTGKSNYALIVSTFSLTFNIGLNVLLIPSFGINGAVFASAVAIIVSNILAFIFMYRRFKMHPYDKSYIKIFSVFVISVLSISIIDNFYSLTYYFELVINGVIYTIIFGVLSYFTILNSDERRKIDGFIANYTSKSNN